MQVRLETQFGSVDLVLPISLYIALLDSVCGNLEIFLGLYCGDHPIYGRSIPIIRNIFMDLSSLTLMIDVI